MDGYIVMDGSSDGNSLSSTQFEHRLHVLSKEGSLNRHLVREIRIDDARNPLEYLAESQIRILLLAHVNDTHHHQLSLIAHDAYHTIAHHVGSRVNSKNDLLCIILFQFLILWLKLSVHVRIVRQFLANAGSIAMTRKHLGFIREHT